MLTIVNSARTFQLPDVEFAALASPSSGSRENSAWIVSVQPGSKGQPHSLSREEIFIALEGSASVRSGGQEFELHAGGSMIVPADTEFALSNPSGTVFRAVAILPAGAQAIMGDGTRFTPPWAS
jgi:mannose-6-phosphate isomerase-like protein (cupin superfamily)